MYVMSLRRLRPYLRVVLLLFLLGFLGLVLPRLLGTLADRLFPPGQAGPEGRPLSTWDILSRWLAWLVRQLRQFMEGGWSTEGVSIREGFGGLC